MAYRPGPRNLYKGHYFIVFYDEYDEHLLYMFDNVKEILKFMHKDITKDNFNKINVMLYRALKSSNHIVRFLTGEIMHVYMIDIN